MATFKMKYFGSCVGKNSGRVFLFDKDEMLEAEKGDIPDYAGEEQKQARATRQKPANDTKNDNSD